MYMYIWIITIILLLIGEFMTSNVATIWYAISAAVSLILSILIDNYIIEMLTFIILGTLLLIIFRPVLNTYLKNKIAKIKRK